MELSERRMALFLEEAGIAWREPVVITVPGVGQGLGCRLCIAMNGLRGDQVVELPQTRDAFEEHMAGRHDGGVM